MRSQKAWALSLVTAVTLFGFGSGFGSFAAGQDAHNPAVRQRPGKNAVVVVDPAKSAITWLGKKVTGQHNGTVALKSGQVFFDGDTLTGGEFEIDMTSIRCDDLKDAEYNKKLVDHLKSDDFFSVDKYKTVIFKMTSVKPLEGKKDATHEITGDLTIKGVTHPVTFPALIVVKDGQASAKGKVTVDRTQYGIRYGSGQFFKDLGDKMIDDNFELGFDLQSTR